MQDEQASIRLAKEGDEQAFEALVTAYERKVYNYALRSTGNEQDAMDITQEVFLRVFRSLSGFKEESSFSTWLYRITFNICIDFSRKNAKRNENSLSLDGEAADGKELELPDERHAPETAYDRKELREEIAGAILRLSEQHREVLVMREISGLSYAEIAEVLELEEGTVKSRIARARENLRKIIVATGNIFGPKASNTHERGRE